MKVLILWGGDSPERDISKLSGENMQAAALAAGYDVEMYDPIDGDALLEQAVARNDIVLIAMHGRNSEDGTIQSKLESLGAKYLGTNSAHSAVAFDKIKAHQLFEANGIKMPEYAVVNDHDFAKNPISKRPFVLKPILGGSSLDTVVVRDVHDVAKLQECDTLLKKYPQMLLEQLIDGLEVTVPVLGEEVLPAILAIPPEGGEFDYENKYNGKSQEIVPIPPETIASEKQLELQQLAHNVHKIAGCRHLSRTDIMLDKALNPYVLEINTLPGMTKESFFPKAAKAVGYTMPELIVELIKLIEES